MVLVSGVGRQQGRRACKVSRSGQRYCIHPEGLPWLAYLQHEPDLDLDI